MKSSKLTTTAPAVFSKENHADKAEAALGAAFDAFVVQGCTYAEAAQLVNMSPGYLRRRGAADGWTRHRIRYLEVCERARSDGATATTALEQAEAELGALVRARRRLAALEGLVSKRLTAFVEAQDADGGSADLDVLDGLLRLNASVVAQARFLGQTNAAEVAARVARLREFVGVLDVRTRGAVGRTLTPPQALAGPDQAVAEATEGAADDVTDTGANTAACGFASPSREGAPAPRASVVGEAANTPAFEWWREKREAAGDPTPAPPAQDPGPEDETD